jgi:FtsP/CotA-like multicopper oxidase with cupredoxin domain
MRRLFRWVLVGIGVIVIAIAGGLAWIYFSAPESNVGELDFEQELRIPPLYEGEPDGDGRVAFELELGEGTSEILPGTETETWGVNGPYLGPTLRAARGEKVTIGVHNRLPETTTTLHWHGMHLPAYADGGPHQTIEPGETWSPEWTIDQPAATLWYHPHQHRETEEHVYRGLAGMFILDDPAVPTSLPDEYGVDDIPVIIQDKRFDDDGELDSSQSIISPIGRLGDEILINGTHDPHLDVSSERVRLRLLNASTARIYNVGFADDREFQLIATDGGLLEAPEPMSRIQLSVGERAEIVAELAPGERVVLRSFGPDLGTNPFEGRFAGEDDTFDLLEIRAAEDLEPAPELPARLAPLETPDEADAVRERRFELGNREINGRQLDLARIDQVVNEGTAEIWEVENTTGTPHSFHPHDVRFRILEYAGASPPPALAGLKDTVYVPPGETVRLITEFTDYTNPDLPYVFHCHILEHEDRGMMGQFAVVEAGGEAGTPPGSHDH